MGLPVKTMTKNNFQKGHLVSYLEALTTNERVEFYKELKSMDTFKKSIPLHFLFSRATIQRSKMTKNDGSGGEICINLIQAEVYEVALRILSNLFIKRMHCQLIIGWYAFLRNLHYCKTVDLNGAAIKIQCNSRRIQAIRLLEKMKKQARRESITVLRKQQQKLKRIHEKATIIQRYARVLLLKKRLLEQENKVASVVIIQNAWKRTLFKLNAWSAIRTMLNREICAVKIQSCYRSFRCQQMARYLQHQNTRLKLFPSKFLFTKKCMMENFFKRQGAAYTIQIWWRGKINIVKLCTIHTTDLLKKIDNCAHEKIQILNVHKSKAKQEGGTVWGEVYLPRFVYNLYGEEEICENLSNNFWKSHSFYDYGNKSCHFNRKDKEAKTIQQAWRYGIARRKLWLLIHQNYQKIIYQNNDFFYVKRIDMNDTKYMNDVSSMVFTKSDNRKLERKPTLFKDYDIQNPAFFPKDELSLERLCDFCGIEQVRWIDAHVQEAYCHHCHIQVHTVGRQKKNRVFPLKICIHCDMQLATKKCLPCDDYYCDCCFFQQHSFTPILKLHPYTSLYANCVQCNKFVATKKVDFEASASSESKENLTQSFCQPCFDNQDLFKNLQNKSKSKSKSPHIVQIELIPIEVKVFLEKQKKESLGV